MSMVDRIQALRKKIPENGASEEEAMAAISMAQKLMEKFGITEEDLRKVEFGRDMRTGEFVQRQKAVHPSQKFCGVTVSKFCGIKVWGSNDTSHGRKILKMFGMNGDVEMAEFLFQLIHDSMDRGWKEFLANSPKKADVSRHTEYWSFMLAFGTRINEKLKAMMEETIAHSEGGTDLVVAKERVVEQGMEIMIPGLRLKKGRAAAFKADRSAYAEGAIAGDKVNLSRPLGNRPNGNKRLA